MKIKKRVGIGFLMVLIVTMLVACGGKKEETTIYEKKQNGLESIITYYHQGDKVLRQTTRNAIRYADFGIKNKEAAKAKLDSAVEQYKGVSGITHKITYNENDMLEEMEVNFSKLDYEKAKTIPGFIINGDPKEGISLTKCHELLEKQNYKKVEK